jgi:hypothetical protein
MKRKIMVSVLVIALAIFSGGPTSFVGLGGGSNVKTAHAGGIPTIDIAAIMQKLISYLTQLMEYSEAINNVSENAKQYAQMIRDYQQKLREYQHYLNQIQSIRHMISNEDWLRLMQTINNYYGRSKRSVIMTMDVNSGSYETDIDQVLGNYGYVPKDPTQVQSDAQSLNMWTPQYQREVERDHEIFNAYKDRLRLVSRNAARSRERQQQEIPALTQALSSLGDESDLQTLQLMAAENLTMIKQKEQELDILNQQLAFEQNKEAVAAAKRAKARHDELTRLRNRQRVQTPGNNRWGKL